MLQWRKPMEQKQLKRYNVRDVESAADGDNRVITKTAGRPQAALHRAAYELSASSAFFDVPRIIAEDVQSRTITMEYLPGLISLKDCLARLSDSSEMLSRVGFSLGMLHRRLRLPPEMVVPAPDPWLGDPSDRVIVHGDFNAINLCYDPRRERLVILDWETSPALPFTCTQASRYLDAAQFVRSLLLQQRSLMRGGLFFTERVRCFLAGYEQGAGVSLDTARLHRFLRAYGKMVMKKQWSAGKVVSWIQSGAGSVLMKILYPASA